MGRWKALRARFCARMLPTPGDSMAVLSWPSPDMNSRARRVAEALRRVMARWQRWEPTVYTLFAGTCVLLVALRFYDSLRQQTLQGLLWHRPEIYSVVIKHGLTGPWSAPLDDVFIHFDFARSLARGYPFEWSEGNGYSSGGTSLLYPAILAVGYWLGWRGLSLMQWAAVVACVSLLALLMCTRRLFSGLPRWTSYLAPPAVLGVGGLSWSLFSGMEIALLAALWAAALLAWDDLVRAATEQHPTRSLNLGGLRLGLWLAAVVATRPEGAVVLLVLAASVGWVVARRFSFRAAAMVVSIIAAPSVVVLGGHAALNFAYTGSTSAAGALAKLEMHNAKLSAAQVWESWWFFLKYQVLRVTRFHLASTMPNSGWALWGLLPFGIIPRCTRRYALVLITTMVLWTALVSLNGQVRWQNERYSMPAVLWFMLAAALGAAVLLTRWSQTWFGRKAVWIPRIVAAIAAIAIFASQQADRFRQQLWFFGRASRNIFEQHVQVGYWLRAGAKPAPRRVMVGDAGAMPYVSDVPALDLIGLGGYHGLPFAQAARLSVGAGIELIEHLPAEDRPDVMALYPSWWGDLPVWFGARTIAMAYARGNVVCGGWTKVVYATDWSPLARSALPSCVHDGGVVIDEVDVADLVSEKHHDVAIGKAVQEAAEMKILPDPSDPDTDLWDAGRVLAAGQSLSFTVNGLRDAAQPRLVLRTAPYEPAELAVSVGSWKTGIRLRPHDGWKEFQVPMPAAAGQATACTVTAAKGSMVLYHIWVVASPP